MGFTEEGNLENRADRRPWACRACLDVNAGL